MSGYAGLPDRLDAGSVVLRPLRLPDAPDIAAACVDEQIQWYLPRLPCPYTVADAEAWLTGPRPGRYAVADPDTDQLLGTVGLVGAVHDGAVELGYWIASWARRRGVATAALRGLTEACLGAGITRTALRIRVENTPSQRTALAAGYRREGVIRAAGHDRTGEHYDAVGYARIYGDPPGPTPRVLPDLPGGHLTDGVVTLRVLRAGDAAACHALRSRPEAYLTRVPPEPPTLRQTQHQCTTAESRWLAGDFARLAICDVRGGELVGEIGLFLIEPPTRQGTLGYDLAPAWRGRGYATRAARLVAAWAFGAAGFDRLTAGTRVDNVASQRVLQRCGFRQEGLERGRLPGPDGLRYDHVLYGLLPADLTGSDQLSPTRR